MISVKTNPNLNSCGNSVLIYSSDNQQIHELPGRGADRTLMGLTALSILLDGSTRFGFWLTSCTLQASPLAAGKSDVVPLTAVC